MGDRQCNGLWRGPAEVTTQFLRYALAGGAALAIHLAVMWIAVEGLSTPKVLASAIGFICAIPVNYLLQYRFVFCSGANAVTSFLLYIGVTLVMMGVNVMVFSMLLALLPSHYLLVQCITSAIVFVANFFANRSWTFSRATVSAMAFRLESCERMIKEKWIWQREK